MKFYSQVDQLAKIFSVLGTPTETEWPEDSSVLRSSFSSTRPRDLADILPELDPEAKDLMEVSSMLTIREKE